MREHEGQLFERTYVGSPLDFFRHGIFLRAEVFFKQCVGDHKHSFFLVKELAPDVRADDGQLAYKQLKFALRQRFLHFVVSSFRDFYVHLREGPLKVRKYPRKQYPPPRMGDAEGEGASALVFYIVHLMYH
ncbi:hypothetical protein SDC9_151309 [bioreactor metagenome]|uniref:Uncharacterized protein n=1 Tax=bioreactor metagenome TaxID=1076179 RepID=A0A645EU73_9ZZZZ